MGGVRWNEGYSRRTKPRAIEIQCQDPANSPAVGEAVEKEVAEGVRYQRIPIALDPLKNMGVMPDHEIDTRIDQTVRHLTLLGGRSRIVFLAPMDVDDDELRRWDHSNQRLERRP